MKRSPTRTRLAITIDSVNSLKRFPSLAHPNK